ncbi:MAG: transcriptional regulator, partial [Alphaproteobacteria bacterium]
MPVDSDRRGATGGGRTNGEAPEDDATEEHATEDDATEDDATGRQPALQVRLLGTMTVSRDGAVLPLPASRKVRALFAYLSLAPHAVTRSHLCELLWDVPNDPRGELRWCLSKIRSLVDGADRRHIRVAGDTIRLDLTDCSVDAIEVAHAVHHGVQTLDPSELRTLAAFFEGDFLEGLEIDRSPAFDGWLAAQRRRFRGYRAALLERLVASIPDEEAFDYLETWRELAPFDLRVHERILTTLARCGRIREGEEHLAVTSRLFDTEDMDCTALRDAWRSARLQVDSAPRAAAVAVAPERPERRDEPVAAGSRRASVAVMPFADRSGLAATRGGPADGLVHDVITRLAKLRSLFVIAQGTVFALQERGIGPEQAGTMLNVDYIVAGSLQRHGEQLTVSVELTETRTARILWTEVFDHRLDRAFAV